MLTEEEAQAFEQEWAAQLTSASTSLVVQVEYDDQIALEILEHVGTYLKSNHAFVHVNFPASFLIGINCVTSRELKEGTLWPAIFAALGVADTTNMRERISTLHQHFLDKFQLARFDHPLPFIGEIQLHAGVPVHSQGKFISKLIKAYSDVQNLNGSVFNAIIRSISKSDVPSKGLDMPIWWFIQKTGEVAEDFVDKCIDLLDDLQDDGIRNSDGGAGLPTRVINEIERIVKLGGRITRSTSLGQRVPSPAIRWHDINTENEVHLELPNLADKLRSIVSWSVDDQVQTETLNTYPPLVPGSNARPDFVMLKRATPQVYVESRLQIPSQELQGNRNWRLKLYTDENPVLVFDEAGILLDSNSTRLAPTVHTFLFPLNSSVGENQMEVAGEHSTQELDSPNGWTGWKALRIDLRFANSLMLKSGANARPSTRRFVSSVRKPSYNFESVMIPGIYSAAGQPVYSGLPSVLVPPNANGTAQLTISIRNALRQVVWTSSSQVGSVSFDLNDLNPPELDGNYEITVDQGGLGGTLRADIWVVSDLKATLERPIRSLKLGGGLDKTSVNLIRNLISVPVSFGPTEIARAIDDRRLSSFDLVVRVPYETIELYNKSSGRRSEWITTARSHLEDLVNLEINFRSPEIGNRIFVASWSDGHKMSLTPSATSNRSRFSLAQLVDDAAIHGAFEIGIFDPQGNLFCVAAKCYEKKLVHAVDYDNIAGCLTLNFGGKSIPSDLRVAIYPSNSPWLGNLQLDVTSEVVDVPKSITRFGDFSATFAVSDVWAPYEFPEKPETGENTLLVENLPALDVSIPEEALSHWLATGEKVPAVEDIPIRLVWICYLNKGILAGRPFGSKLRQFALEKLQSSPDAALQNLPAAPELPDNYMSLVFQTGLVVASAIENFDRIESFTSKPFLAILQTKSTSFENYSMTHEWADSALGVRVSHTYSDDGEELAPDIKVILKKKAEQLSFVSLPSLTIHPLLANWTDEQFDEFGESNSLVPGRLFDSGSLFALYASIVKDAMDLGATFKVGQVENYLDTIIACETDLTDVFDALAEARPKAKQSAIEDFRARGGVRSNIVHIPALSIRLALIARMTARGDQEAEKLWEMFELIFQDLSTKRPALVERDLVLAELYLMSIEGEKNGNN